MTREDQSGKVCAGAATFEGGEVMRVASEQPLVMSRFQWKRVEVSACEVVQVV